VWMDDNGKSDPNPARGNGRVDEGEKGLAGVEVQLFAGESVSGAPLRTTKTDAGGFYLFDELLPGKYVVHIPPSEFAPNAPLAGLGSSLPNGEDTDQDDNEDENGQNLPGNLPTNGISSTVISLAVGAEPIAEAGQTGGQTSTLPDANVNLTVDFGFWTSTTGPETLPIGIGNRIWRDESAGGFDNGLLDPGEKGIKGVKLNLYKDSQPDGIPDGQAILTTTTDADGYYLFQVLLAAEQVTNTHHYIV
ncbi:MAG TPA: SdrD B-like domain-containing protein, partial [Caldilineaceae bacterium]|nr:SdrD B-like domain-containing protein [Caldilineaceae bacterium]